MEGRVRVQQIWKSIPSLGNSLAEAQRYPTVPVAYSLPWWLVVSVYSMTMNLDTTFARSDQSGR